MQNWKPEHTKEIKAWLNIDTYRKFEEVSLLLLYHELWARTLFFKTNREGFEQKAFLNYQQQIFNGDPFLIEEERLGYLNMVHQLLDPPHFLLTNTEEIALWSIVAMKRGMFFWKGGDDYEINKSYSEIPLSESMPDFFKSSILLELDLESGTDEQIAESLKSALPQWRKFKGVSPNPVETMRFGYGVIKKIINYRLIPMLDILFWASCNDVRISEDRLSRLLYTDDDDESQTRLHYQIKDTDRPLAMKAITKDFIRQFNFFINKNSILKNMRVSDVMKLTDPD